MALCSSTILFLLSASSYSVKLRILSSVFFVFSFKICSNFRTFCSSAKDFLLSFSISFFKNKSSFSLRLLFLVKSSIIAFNFFYFSAISISICLTSCSFYIFSCSVSSKNFLNYSFSLLAFSRFLTAA